MSQDPPLGPAEGAAQGRGGAGLPRTHSHMSVPGAVLWRAEPSSPHSCILAIKPTSHVILASGHQTWAGGALGDWWGCPLARQRQREPPGNCTTPSPPLGARFCPPHPPCLNPQPVLGPATTAWTQRWDPKAAPCSRVLQSLYIERGSILTDFYSLN